MTRHTEVEKSGEHIDVDSVKRGSCGAGCKLIKLEDVQCLVPFQSVSCEVKVPYSGKFSLVQIFV